MSDEQVPGWCSFFDADEYQRFRAAVESACGCFGAETQDYDDGTITMVAGVWLDECYFDLAELAARCRDRPADDDWESICSNQVFAWAHEDAQRAWLTQVPFAAVEPDLRIWLASEQTVAFQGGRLGDPDESLAIPLADGLYAGLAVEVPELDGASEMTVAVPYSAVYAWRQSAVGLLEAARRRLRQLPPLLWERVTAPENSGLTGELLVGRTPAGVDAAASEWVTLLREAPPVPAPRGALVAVPERDVLVFAARTDDAAGADDRDDRDLIRLVRSYTDWAYHRSDHSDQITRTIFTLNLERGILRSVATDQSAA